MDRRCVWTRSVGAALILSVFAGCTVPTGAGMRTFSMHVESVKLDPRTSTPVILLQEEEGARRRLPIWIGVYEAQSIAMGMEKITSPRPNAHDLMRNLVEKIDGRVARVLITELKGGVYYALLEIEIDGRTVAVDSRPSDAIALAIRTGTPVYATDEVLRQGGVPAEGGEAVDIDWRVLRQIEGEVVLRSH